MLGNNIFELRKKMGLSQEELSEKIGVTRQTISNWELNETQPNPEQLKLLSKSLNVSVDELINNDIKSVLEEKVSKTARLTSIIYKVVILIVVILFVMFVSSLVGGLKNRFDHSKNKTIVKELNCSLDDENYIIEYGSDNRFECYNCPEELKNELNEKYFKHSDMEKSTRNIKFYFKEHNGVCK